VQTRVSPQRRCTPQNSLPENRNRSRHRTIQPDKRPYDQLHSQRGPLSRHPIKNLRSPHPHKGWWLLQDFLYGARHRRTNGRNFDGPARRKRIQLDSYFLPQLHRLVVKTQGFEPCDPSSILGVAKLQYGVTVSI